MRDIDDMSARSRGIGSNIMGSSLVSRIRPSIAISSSRVNHDNLVPDVSVRREDLVSVLEDIDKRAKDKIRPVIDRSRGLASVRLVPQHLSRDSNGASASARSYRPTDHSVGMPDRKKVSEDERVYIIMMKFNELHQRNPSIRVPDGTHDADSLERMYYEALRSHRRTKVGASWFIYLGVGYYAMQYVIEWFGLKLPENFVLYQLKALSHYTDVIRQLGDPGGISVGSSWPPWLKMLVIVILQTITFVVAYKITGSEQAAAGAQEFIASTNFMNGATKNKGDLEAEGAAMDVGNFMGLIKGAMNGEGGGMIGNLMSVFGGGSSQNIDLDDLPEPEEEDNGSASSRRANVFD